MHSPLLAVTQESGPVGIGVTTPVPSCSTVSQQNVSLPLSTFRTLASGRPRFALRDFRQRPRDCAPVAEDSTSVTSGLHSTPHVPPFAVDLDVVFDYVLVGGGEGKSSVSFSLQVPCLCDRCRSSAHRALDRWFDLVGIEPNPGPKKKTKTVVVVAPQGSRKKRGKASGQVSGSGRYREVGGGGGKKEKSIGSQIGAGLGSWVGDMAQKALMSITGFGDYKVKSNSLIQGATSEAGPPQFTANGRHSVVVCHREFVAPVTSVGGAFSTIQYYINPTSALFPWLAALASNFELFRFHGLIFEFKATSATAVASTNTALGSVILATQYNALSPPFASQMSAEAYEYCTSTVAFTSCIHPVECAPTGNVLEEQYTDLAYSGGDPRFTILGILNVMTVGQQAGSTLGELWVSYHVELIRPRLFGVIATQGYTFRVASNAGNAISPTDYFALPAAALVSNAQLLDNVGYPTQNYGASEQSLEVILGSASVGTNGGLSNTIVFPRGIYGAFVVTIYVSATTAASVSYPTIAYSGGLVSLNLFNQGAVVFSNQISPNTGVSSTTYTYRLGVLAQPVASPTTNLGQLPTLTFGTSSVNPGGTNGTYMNIEIVQVNS